MVISGVKVILFVGFLDGFEIFSQSIDFLLDLVKVTGGVEKVSLRGILPKKRGLKIVRVM